MLSTKEARAQRKQRMFGKDEVPVRYSMQKERSAAWREKSACDASTSVFAGKREKRGGGEEEREREAKERRPLKKRTPRKRRNPNRNCPPGKGWGARTLKEVLHLKRTGKKRQN